MVDGTSIGLIPLKRKQRYLIAALLLGITWVVITLWGIRQIYWHESHQSPLWIWITAIASAAFMLLIPFGIFGEAWIQLKTEFTSEVIFRPSLRGKVSIRWRDLISVYVKGNMWGMYMVTLNAPNQRIQIRTSYFDVEELKMLIEKYAPDRVIRSYVTMP